MERSLEISPKGQRSPDKELVPRVMVRVMTGLCVLILAIVTIARLTDQPLSATPPGGEIAQTREVILSGDMSGAASVHSADGSLIAEYTGDEGGFISGVWRVIRRERMKSDVALEAPVTLIRYRSGRISIVDPMTGWSADLMGFGVDNAKAFGRLLAQ